MQLRFNFATRSAAPKPRFSVGQNGEQRAQGRAAIARLEAQIAGIESQARDRADERARHETWGERPFRDPRTGEPLFLDGKPLLRGVDCRFGLGKSGETKALRARFQEYLADELRARAPEIEALERKIERTRQLFGFND
jgi:hypothetical protein